MVHGGACVVLFLLVESSLSLVNNSMIEARNELEELRENTGKDAGARRVYEPPKKTDKSTSSDSGDEKSATSSGESLKHSLTESDSGKKKADKYIPKSSEERKGWRKWHRKCHPCPEEMKMKWRDPRIKWICGAFQRARRTFKSICMMHYRNCQDGTMFVKIYDHRCQNSSRQNPTGDHFFYDYRVRLAQDSGSATSEASSEERSSAD